MQKISDIIKLTLLTGEGIYLPRIGALVTQRRPASSDGKSVAAPIYEVLLYPDGNQGTYSIIDYMCRFPGMDREQANEIYNQWFQESASTDIINIEEVGELKDDKFTPVQAFDQELNPNRGKQFKLPKKRSNVWLWILLGLILLALAIYGVILLRLGMPQGASVPAQEQTEVTGQTSIAASDTATSIFTEPAATPATSPQKVASDRVKTSQLAAGRYYVVLGVFSEPANADKMTEKILALNKGLDIEKLPYKGKTMVTIYSSTDQTDAINNMRKLRSIHSEVWLYHSK